MLRAGLALEVLTISNTIFAWKTYKNKVTDYNYIKKVKKTEIHGYQI